MIDNYEMDIFEIRRLNLQYLINIKSSGNAADFARKISKDGSYINRCLYEGGKKGKKRISDEIISAILDTFTLPPGWMDIPQWNNIQENKPIYTPPGTSVPDAQVIQTRYINWSDYCLHPNSITKIQELDFMTIKSGTLILGELFAIDIDSNLFKDYPAGTRILFDTKKPPEKTKTVLISIGDEKPTLVRWCPGFGKLNVQPLEIGQPETVTLDEEQVTVHGVAIAIGTKTIMI